MGTWAEAFVYLRFDLEHGALVETQVPDEYFGPAFQKEISFLGLPDSNNCKGDCSFTFKIRDANGSFLYGYTYFRQQRDPNVQRGVIQTSIVLFSRWPFGALLRQAVRATASQFYSLGAACPGSPTRVSLKGMEVLESSLDQMRRWPAIRMDTSYELPLFSKTLKFKTPYTVSIFADNQMREAGVRGNPILDSPPPPVPCDSNTNTSTGDVLPVEASPQRARRGSGGGPTCRGADLKTHRMRSKSWNGPGDVVFYNDLFVRWTWEICPQFTVCSPKGSVRSIQLLAGTSTQMHRCSPSPPLTLPPSDLSLSPLQSRSVSPSSDEDSRRGEAKRSRKVDELILGPIPCRQAKTPSNSLGDFRLTRSSSIQPETSSPPTKWRNGSNGKSETPTSPPSTPLTAPAPDATSPLTPQAVLHWQHARLGGRGYAFSDINIYKCLKSQLHNLWKLWELIMLGKPLVVLGCTPNVSSDVILSLVSLTSPVPYAGDVRPYFTVQDTDYTYFSSLGVHRPFPNGILLGVTNPIFATACAGWPNFLSVLISPKSLQAPTAKMLNFGKHFTPQERMVFQYRECFLSKHKFVVSENKEFLKTLLHTHSLGIPVAMLEEINSDAIRRHFLELTHEVLYPLRSCLESIWGAVKIPILLASPALRMAQVFPRATFCEWLKSKGWPKLFSGTKSEVLAFYESFMKTPGFSVWLRESVEENLKRDIGCTQWSVELSNTSEEQRIEVYTLLRQKHSVESAKYIQDTIFLSNLERGLQIVGQLLPEHVFTVLQKKNVH